ncbi:hypothetical protein OSB04_011924 [Centaurea solstitialis]|uniref:Uncharacterized protein n=1 Tax=Centaurea solstitialis TaxID=347529 RepID=A0AA38TAE0_9ASTR|nr:hypothetical protein OSB04_011924 [Centaurea solstitialis]
MKDFSWGEVAGDGGATMVVVARGGPTCMAQNLGVKSDRVDGAVTWQCRKIALMLALCKQLRDKYSLVAVSIVTKHLLYSNYLFSVEAPHFVIFLKSKASFTTLLNGLQFYTFNSIVALHLIQVTKDIFTKEDSEFLVKYGALSEERIRAVETRNCPHAAIREDININLIPLEELSNLYKTNILLCESMLEI